MGIGDKHQVQSVEFKKTKKTELEGSATSLPKEHTITH